MNVFTIVSGHVRTAVAALEADGQLPAGLDLSRIVVEPPRDASHGDIATNAAMVLAKEARQEAARTRRGDRAKAARRADLARKVEVAGPGFINLTLKPAAWTALCAPRSAPAAITAASDIGKGEPVNVEYVSANPTGPMHVGHCRGAVFGDALAEPPGLHRLCGDARVLHQRRRRPGRRARPLGLPALPRGAGRDISADPRRALSRRLPQAGRRGARRRVRQGAAPDQTEAEWLPVVRAKSRSP